MESGNLPPEIHLELEEAIDSTHSAALMDRFKEIQANLSEDELTASYQGLLYGGDPDRARTILFRNQSAQCMRCHAIDDYGSNVGPRLNGVGERLTRQQLLESLIDPSARIAPGYGVVTLNLENGKTLSGTLQDENNIEVVLKVGDKPDTVILKEHIAKRTNAPSSMPDMKNFLTKKQIRDLVSLLATLKEEDI